MNFADLGKFVDDKYFEFAVTFCHLQQKQCKFTLKNEYCSTVSTGRSWTGIISSKVGNDLVNDDYLVRQNSHSVFHVKNMHNVLQDGQLYNYKGDVLPKCEMIQKIIGLIEKLTKYNNAINLHDNGRITFHKYIECKSLFKITDTGLIPIHPLINEITNGFMNDCFHMCGYSRFQSFEQKVHEYFDRWGTNIDVETDAITVFNESKLIMGITPKWTSWEAFLCSDSQIRNMSQANTYILYKHYCARHGWYRYDKECIRQKIVHLVNENKKHCVICEKLTIQISGKGCMGKNTMSCTECGTAVYA